MTVITVLGDPDDLCNFLDLVIAGGNDIKIIRKTRNKATYVVVFQSSGPLSYLLMETGEYVLLENGDKIIL